jgi:hypothetical protein
MCELGMVVAIMMIFKGGGRQRRVSVLGQPIRAQG